MIQPNKRLLDFGIVLSYLPRPLKRGFDGRSMRLGQMNALISLLLKILDEADDLFSIRSRSLNNHRIISNGFDP